MNDLDKSFVQMEKLLIAVWPSVKQIDWSDYCSQNHKPGLDQDPWYTGLMLYATNGADWERYAIAGEISRPKDSLQMVRNKASEIIVRSDVSSSMEVRNPEKDIWAGGFKSNNDPNVIYCLTELPDVADHLLLNLMMLVNEMRGFQATTAAAMWYFPNMQESCRYLGMSVDQLLALSGKVSDIMQDATS